MVSCSYKMSEPVNTMSSENYESQVAEHHRTPSSEIHVSPSAISDPAAVAQWRVLTHRQRCRIVGRCCGVIASQTQQWTDRLATSQRFDPVESITAEIIPMCAALKRIGRRGHKILAARRLGIWGRPPWLIGVRQTIQRRPHGIVLVLGTWNYPLLLVGVQVAQAVAAGNEVWIKPAIGCTTTTLAFVDSLIRAGVPSALLRVLGETVDDATDAMDHPVDLVVMTGSARTASAVMRRCAETLTPVIAEASGCDAMICLADVQPAFIANLVHFGLTLNSGATCISPRRIYVAKSNADLIADAVDQKLASVPMMVVHPAARPAVIEWMRGVKVNQIITGELLPADFADHGRMRPTIVRLDSADDHRAQCDVFAPVAGWQIYDDAHQGQPAVNDCKYGLAASIIGPEKLANEFAQRLDVGTVVINDLIVPTADPRVPFGGRRMSGFGVTRGDEGLLAMTVSKVIATRKHGPMAHLRPRADLDQKMLTKLTRWLYR